MKKLLFAFLCSVSFHLSSAQDLLSQSKTERLYKSGIDLMMRNEYGSALQNFEDFLRFSPVEDVRRSDAGYYRALCGLYLYHVDAEKRMEDFMESHATSPATASAHFDLGNFYYNDKNYSRAATEYNLVEFATLSTDQRTTGRFRFGYSLFNQKKLKESLDQFNYIKTGGGQYGPASSYYAGFIEDSQGEWDAALIDLNRAEQNPAYAKIVPYLIVHVQYKRKNYDELLRYVATLKDRDGLSNQEEIALLVAEAQFKKEDYKSALTGYQQYLKDKSNADRGVLYRAGYAAFTLGQEKAALDYFKSSAAASDSVGFYASYYLGVLYLKQQQKPLALTAFENSRKMPGDFRLAEESAYQYAKICYDLGRPDEAIAEFEKFLVAYPSSVYVVEVKELLSQGYVNANNYNKAIEYIESLPSRSPAINRAYQKATFLKGTELFNKEEYAQAVKFLERSLQSPVDPVLVAEANFWCGETYSIGKKYPQAAANYEVIFGIESYKNSEILTKARYGLGYALYNQQKYDKALVNFKEYVAKSTPANFNFADGLLRLADCYYVTKSYAEALSNYKKVILVQSPDADYAHLQAGVIYGIQRKYADASGELDQVIKNYPQSRYLDEAVFQRGQFYFEQGSYASAVADFSTLIAANKPSRFLPYAYQRRAAAYYNLKDYNKTADDYIALMEKFPSHPVTTGLLSPLQEALTLSGRGGEFEKYLAQFKTANPGAKEIESVEFEAAKNLYFSEEYQKAINSLVSYASSYPNSPRLTEANYYRAESMYRLNDFANALTLYSEIGKDNTFSLANKVTGRLAELEFKQHHFDKAIPYFQRLSKIATSKKDQYTAWSGLMECYFLQAQYDSSQTYAKLILEKGKVNAGAENKASLYLGKIAMAKGDYETAKDEFLTTLNSARDEYGAEAKYLLGEVFYLSKDHKQCYETLISLNRDFASYPEWVGKSYLLLADNYISMGETFQAKGTLNSLIDKFPSQNVKDQAREKLKKIEDAELKNKPEPSESDSTTNKKD